MDDQSDIQSNKPDHEAKDNHTTNNCFKSLNDVASVSQLRAPLQLASLITPIYCLSHFQIVKRTFNKRTVIDLASKLKLHQKPEILTKVEGHIFDTIFQMARGDVAPSILIKSLLDALPWEELIEASKQPAIREWFRCATGKNLLDSYVEDMVLSHSFTSQML